MNQQAYEKILDQIREKVISYDDVDPTQVNAFFKRITLQVFNQEGHTGFVMLTADNEFIQRWFNRNFLDKIKKALKELFDADFTVSIEVFKSNTTPDKTNISSSVSAPVKPQSHKLSQQQNEIASQKSTGQILSKQEDRKHNEDAAYNKTAADQVNSFSNTAISTARSIEECTFENFVQGDSNNLALSRAMFVAENPVNSRTNPLFIYGESGLGKTHLLLAIKNYINQNYPDLNVIYIDTMDFVNEYVDAGRNKDKKTSFYEIRHKYETTDVLLMDDVQNLQRKSETLNMVFQILNTMLKYGRQIVLAADRHPKNIDIDERYQSRFSQGGTVQIYPPEFETKYGIIKSYIDECAAVDQFPYHLSDEVMEYIARTSGPNIRDLKGGINDILFAMRDHKKETLSLVEVKSLLKDRLSATTEQRLLISDIQKKVAKFYQVAPEALASKKRARNVAHARQIAMYFCRVLLEKTEGDIGKAFNRDHSTVHHSIELIKVGLKDNRDLQEEIEVLQQMITGE